MEIDDYIVAEDRRLAELVLAGDDTAFEYLFNRYRDAIHRLFAQRLGGIGDIDDLLQETFIKVYINLHRYDARYTFGQWVYTIARNTFVDFVRRRQEDLPIDERFAAPVAPGPTPEESVINLQQRTQIEHYLERLTPRYRQLIVLRFFDEYSYEEIAAKLSLPLGTVKTQIHRARERMCTLIVRNDGQQFASTRGRGGSAAPKSRTGRQRRAPAEAAASDTPDTPDTPDRPDRPDTPATPATPAANHRP